MAMFERSCPCALLLLAGLVGTASAQTSAKSATASASAERTAAVAEPAKSGVPEGNGRWVPRIDKKTCPKGSETYIDEKDGGVKCWVSSPNTN